MKVICTRCGGTNIACEAIVNPNTGKIIDYLDESFMHANCGDCKEEVVITDVDRVKKDIDSMFFEFVKKNGKEPEYVECQIVWKDTGDDRRTTIKLSLSINDDDNDNVFYYCNGIESLKSLVEYGVGDIFRGVMDESGDVYEILDNDANDVVYHSNIEDGYIVFWK